MNLSTLVPHVSGIKQYLSFYDWFIVLSIISSSFTHVVSYVRISFLFKEVSNILLYIETTFCLSFHLVMDPWLVLAVVNDVAMNMGMRIPLGDPAFLSLGSTPRHGIAGSCNKSIFKVLKLKISNYCFP